MKVSLPHAILLDLDDTIITYSLPRTEAWKKSILQFHDELKGLDPDTLYSAVMNRDNWLWSDENRHKKWRVDLVGARQEVVRLAFEDLGMDSDGISNQIADKFLTMRDKSLSLIPGAVETIHYFLESGIRLVLVTNGASAIQNEKIERFRLRDLFEDILIEGEMGFGKPDNRVYRNAMESLDLEPSDAWMIGDNIVWDVLAPQKAGINGIWINPRNKPNGFDVEPFLTIKILKDIIPFISRYSQGSC